jgi:hypothetical protein
MDCGKFVLIPSHPLGGIYGLAAMMRFFFVMGAGGI